MDCFLTTASTFISIALICSCKVTARSQYYTVRAIGYRFIDPTLSSLRKEKVGYAFEDYKLICIGDASYFMVPSGKYLWSFMYVFLAWVGDYVTDNFLSSLVDSRE